jgi:hypothetical protein
MGIGVSDAFNFLQITGNLREKMSRRCITVEDHVVPQLLTSALEAYEIGDRKHHGKKRGQWEDKLVLTCIKHRYAASW